jgi:biopolymer transport protein ExbB
VFAYNWLQNRNKRISELLAAFATDLLANLTSRGAVKPAIITKTSTQQAARTTAPASAPKA